MNVLKNSAVLIVAVLLLIGGMGASGGRKHFQGATDSALFGRLTPREMRDSRPPDTVSMSRREWKNQLIREIENFPGDDEQVCAKYRIQITHTLAAIGALLK